MKFIAVLLIALMSVTDASAAAARRAGRTPGGGGAKTTTSQQNSQKQTMGARAATNSRTAPRTTGGAAPKTGGRTTGARAAKPAAGKTGGTSAPVVSARAGTTQKVIGSGTKVSTAVKNTVVNEDCTAKYNGCMDAFCMLDNENGGRCICSNKIKNFNSILSQIQDLEKRSYEMATLGVAQIELGQDADAVLETTNSTMSKLDARKNRSSIDLSAWKSGSDEEEQILSSNVSGLDGKQGDELFNAVTTICRERIPECEKDISMLQMLYGRQVESDCAAYKNSLDEKKTKAEQALDTAERTLREAAMEQHQTANKYDLGQCTLKFKECMQTTAGCGDDFSGCATVVANDNTNTNKSGKKNKKFSIEGAVSTIEISASTYDALVAKRPICESVTRQCTRVANQVFDAFLKEAAPQIRNAELIAEDKMRQNCIMNIADCFQNACKDNFDPNNSDGSYDLCLTRPETMLNLCKIPLNACGINSEQESVAQESSIWSFILSRLTSMRVDACTTSIRTCLSDKNRCGKDYIGCIGLDIDSVIQMCPTEKLTSCDSSEYGLDDEAKTKYIYNVAQGLLLGIDNKFREICENAVSTKMIEICGSATDCFDKDNETIGTTSLRTRQIDGGDWLIDGLITWGMVDFKHPDNYNSNTAGYTVTYNIDASNIDKEVLTRINQSVIADIQSELNRKMSILITDPTINMCINGRDMSQIKKGSGRDTARFPNLLVPYANTMFNSLVSTAKANYNFEYSNQFSRANSLSEQYKNTLFCTSMVNKASAGTTMLQEGSGVKEWTDYSVLIAGTSSQNQLDAISAGVDIEDVMYVTETVKGFTQETEIARERTNAVYEPGPQVCRITKTLYPCTGFTSQYDEKSDSFGVEANVTVMGFGGGGGYNQSKSSKKFTGKTCGTYAEPLIIEQLINFKDENVIAGQITRSNLTSMTIDQSSYTTSTSNSWSVGLSASYSDSHDVNVTGNNATVNAPNAKKVKVQNGKK